MNSHPHTIAIGQTVELHDGRYRLVAHRSGTFQLRGEHNGEYYLLHQTELARLLRVSAVVHEPDAIAQEDTLAEQLDGLSADTIALIPHLRELIDGTPAVGDEQRPEYSLHISMTRRRGSKLDELDKLGMPMTERTLQRRLANFKEKGIAGLVDARNTRTETSFSRVDNDVILILNRIVHGYRGRTTTSYAAIRAELQLALADHFPNASDRPRLPSVSSIERYVRQLAGDQNPTLPGAQRQSAALRPTETFRRRLVAAPGDECQMDTTWFDAFVRMPDGRVMRPHLTTLVDVRTRTIIGFNFTDGAPSGEDHSHLLARTLVPHPLRPWSSQYTSLDLPEMPWAPYVDSDQKQFDTHRPYIFPRRIVIDNGQDYRSVVFLAACHRYGIHLTEAPPKAPTVKSHVERHFDTIKTMFTRHLPGYVGGNTQERAGKPENEDLLELRTVVELFDQWVAVIWQNREHDGLINPLEPSVTHTPNSMYAASIEVTGHFTMPLGEDDFIALMPRVKRTVQSDGIELNKRRYDSPYLAPMRLQKDRNGHSVEVSVHYDKADPSQVWVRSTEDGGWITCEWVEDAGLSRPNERKLLADAADFAKKTKRLRNEDAHALTVQLRRDAAAVAKQHREKDRDPKKSKKKQKNGSQRPLAAIEPTRSREARLANYLAYDELDSL